MQGERLWRPDFGESAPDGQSVTDVWDCKALSRQAIVSLYVECEKKYRDWANGRRFHLCLFDPTRPKAGDLVVLKADAYAELVAAADVGRGLVLMFTENEGEKDG
jgi:hypothetical protein